MTVSVTQRIDDIAAQALFDPKSLAATLVQSLGLRDGAPRVLLGAICPCSLAQLALALHDSVPNVVLTLAAPNVDMVAEVRAHLAVCAPAPVASALAVVATRFDCLDGTFGPDSFDAIALPGHLFPKMLRLPHDEHDDDEHDDDETIRNKQQLRVVVPASEDVNAALATVVRVLHVSKTCLATGGKLYVDCVPVTVKHARRRGVEVTLGSLGGTAIADVEWDFVIDEEAYTRMTTIDVVLHDDDGSADAGTKLRAVHVGVLTAAEQLRAGVSYAGFTSFDAVTAAKGKNCDSALQGFVAGVTGDAAYYDRALSWYKSVWNENGAINWGLWNEGFPSKSYADEVRKLADIDGGEKGALVGANQAFTKWVYRKVDDALAAHGKTVRSILDVGCGTGRGTINLANKYRDTLEYALGVDPGTANIAQGRATAADEKDRLGLEVEFFHGTMEQAVEERRKFDLAWSESALLHASDEGRRATLHGIGSRMSPGGVFMLNDCFKGFHALKPRMKLHLFERVHVQTVWSFEQYVSELRVSGFRLIEYVDLTDQMAASYRALAKTAAVCAERAEKGSADEFMLRCLEVDYRNSALGAASGECTWGIMLCRRE